MRSQEPAIVSPRIPNVTEVVTYMKNYSRFQLWDWIKYSSWIGSLLFMFLGSTLFLLVGHLNGVTYPGYVWFIPAGSGLFAISLAVDDIGHRTLYKAQLAKGEGYVHQMIAATAVPSCVALCFAYDYPETFRMPALALIFLSIFYSIVDESMHWFRYAKMGPDRVEMWSHFLSITGHILMISCWWQWFDAGYPGVAETLAIFGIS